MVKHMSDENINLTQNGPASEKSYYRFLFFLSGQLISLLGSSIAGFVIIFWITIVTNSAFYLGLAAFLGFGTTMAVIPFAGVLVDRWSRRKVIALVDALEALATVAIITLFYLEMAEVWHLLVLSTLRGAFQGFHDPAVQAIIPVLVPRDKLKGVNSIQYFTGGLINLIGPLVGAGLIGIFGIENVGQILWIDAVTFFVAVIPLLFISIPSVKVDAIQATKPSFKAEFSEGVTYIRKKKGLLSLLSAFTTANFFVTPLFTLLPLIIVAQSLIGGNQNDLGWAMFFGSLGTLLGSFVMSKYTLFRTNTGGVFWGLLLMYLGNFIAIGGAMTGSFEVLIIGLFINGVMLPVANISSQTIWQTVVPLELQGRVYSVRRFVAQVLGPVAMFLSGIFGELLGIPIVILFTSIAGAIITLYLWLFTALPHVEKMLNANEEIASDKQELPVA